MSVGSEIPCLLLPSLTDVSGLRVTNPGLLLLEMDRNERHGKNSGVYLEAYQYFHNQVRDIMLTLIVNPPNLYVCW